jgi:hypothetical protein
MIGVDICVYLLDKEEAWNIWKVFKVSLDEVENYCNKIIKNLWLDHKGRYLSYKFSKHVKVEESFHRLAFHETPQEYGVFER